MDQESSITDTDTTKAATAVGLDGIRKRNSAISNSLSTKEENDRIQETVMQNGIIDPKISNGEVTENVEDDDEDEDTEEDDDGDDEDEESNEQDDAITETEQDNIFNGSPGHSLTNNNGISISNVLEDEQDDDDYSKYGYDDFEYEYVPKIREPPTDEDSEDGLLVSKDVRDAALSGIAKALLESAKSNQEAYDREKEDGDDLFNGFIHCCGGSRRLKNLEEMPAHLQFNKFVHSGYRDIQNAWGCFLSLFYIHNETVNILTHVAPIIYILLFWRTMYPWQDIEGNTFLNILGWSHIIASISPWTGSVFYHLFMNHNAGPKFYQILLQIDMFGIWVTECFGALTNLTAATWCLPRNIQNYIMVSYGFAAVWGLQKALTAWTPLARRMCFAPVFISRILAFMLRVSSWGGGDSNILAHVILQDVVSVIGGMIGVIRIPEKWFPGKLDIFINSHHIMHVLVVVAVIHMNLASNGDIRWIINNYSQAQCTNPL